MNSAYMPCAHGVRANAVPGGCDLQSAYVLLKKAIPEIADSAALGQAIIQHNEL